MNVIEVDQLSKKFKLGVYGGKTLSDDFSAWLAKIRGKENPLTKVDEKSRVNNRKEFWALRDINFSVKQGEVLGIIGKNGAGKSTLLKLLSRISYPTKGEIRIKGRIASLLEVGTGFHPELTGRENVYLNGAILGMKRVEIQSKFDEIVAFSGIEHHIDTPVKRYSSGMKVRLGFAVAAHLEPEILVVDEVLAVGDAEFQNKCIGKMKDVSNSGRTILFVSHNMSAVRNLCTRGILLSEGKIILDDNVESSISQYLNLNHSKATNSNILHFSPENKELFIEKLEFINGQNNQAIFEHIDHVILQFTLVYQKLLTNCYLGIIINDSNGNVLFVNSTDELENDFFINLNPGKYLIDFIIPSKLLKPGNYYVTFSLRNKFNSIYHKEDTDISFTIIDNFTFKGMKNRYRSNAIVSPEIKFNINQIK